MLSIVPSEAWVGFVGVITGAFLSIFGVWLTNKSSLNQLRMQLLHETESKDEYIKRERLEELYTLVGHWLSGIFSVYISLSLVMQGKLDYNQHLDLVIEKGSNSEYDFKRLEMIIDIYACNIKPEYQLVLKAREDMNEISRKFKQVYEQGDINGSKFLEQYTVAHLKIDKLGKKLKKKIAESANKV